MLPPFGSYVYLKTLENTNHYYAQLAKERSTFNINKSYTIENQSTTVIEQAINQLKNIAATEAVKEQQAVNNYITKIKKFLNSDTPIPENLKKNLELQLQHIKTLDITSYQQDQNSLIQSLNIAIQNINSYKRRLSELNTPAANNIQINTRFEQGLQERVNNFLQHRRSRSKSTETLRDTTTGKLIRQELKKLNLNFPELENELESLLFIDFNNWLENSSIIPQSYDTLDPNEIDTLFSLYEQQSNNNLTETHLQRIFRQAQNDDKELLSLLNDMKSTLRSTYFTDKEYNEYKKWVEEKNQLIEEAEASGKKFTPGGRKIHNQDYSFKQINDLIQTYESKTQKQKEKTYVFTLGTKTSQGNFYERIITFIRSAVDVKGNVAADLILPIATATFSINEQQQQEILMNLSTEIANTMTTHFNESKQLNIDHFNEMVKNQQILHTNIVKNLSEAQNKIQNISEIGEKFFIAHETTKLYRSAEQTKNNRIIDEFHGRKMKILSSLAKLYASDKLSSNMINSSDLIIYLLNVHQDTLAGESNLEPLETYLSLFAGLLMFDDIKEIVDVASDDIINNLNLSTINQLHVYNLGGIYYPVSVILYNLIEQLEQGINTINAIDYSKTAIAKIIPPSKLESPKDSSAASWKSVANSTIHNTELQIHFLQGFNAYINDLLTSFNQT